MDELNNAHILCKKVLKPPKESFPQHHCGANIIAVIGRDTS